MLFQKIVFTPITIEIRPKRYAKKVSLMVQANWSFPVPLYKITRKILLERSFDGRLFYPVYSCPLSTEPNMLFKECIIGYEKVISYRIKLLTDYDIEIVGPVGMYVNKFNHEM